MGTALPDLFWRVVDGQQRPLDPGKRPDAGRMKWLAQSERSPGCGTCDIDVAYPTNYIRPVKWSGFSASKPIQIAPRLVHRQSGAFVF